MLSVGPSNQGVVCAECGRKFSRPSDLKRHKCLSERSKPIEEQRGAMKRKICLKWFYSKGGLAVHKTNAHGQTN